MPRRDPRFRNRRPPEKHKSKEKSRQLKKKLILLVMAMHMAVSRALASDIALSGIVGAVEAVKGGAKYDDMCSTSSTWRPGPLTTQATRL